MRDPFESAPGLRLGDAKAKPRDPLREGDEAIDRSPFSDLCDPKPPSLDPAFGDAFGAALSKPRTYSFEDVDFSIGGVDMGSGADETGITIVSGVDPKVDGGYRTIAAPDRRGLVDWIENHGVYDPAKMPAYPSFAQVDAEVLSEEEFARKYPGPNPMLTEKVYETWIPGRRAGKTIEFGEAASRVALNHSLLVKKDPGP